MLAVSITHPRIILQVYQVQSPAYIFLGNRTSFQLDVALASRGCNTLSSAWNKVHRTWFRLWVGLWDRPKKSSTNMFM